jgi:threonine/homoserine/homoserine lactone efflux protein
MRLAVMIFYWLCAIFLIWLTIRAAKEDSADHHAKH